MLRLSRNRLTSKTFAPACSCVREPLGELDQLASYVAAFGHAEPFAARRSAASRGPGCERARREDACDSTFAVRSAHEARGAAAGRASTSAVRRRASARSAASRGLPISRELGAERFVGPHFDLRP